MKKPLLLILSLSMMTGCSSNNSINNDSSTSKLSTNTDDNAEVISHSFNYLNEINYLDCNYDVSNVSLTINQSDGSEIVLNSDELSINLDEFNSTDKSGKTKIIVSSDEYDISEELEIKINPRTDYKVLFVGNSFSDNVITYMKQISNNLGITSTIANLNYGGCSIDSHNSFIGDDQSVYNYQTLSETGEKINHTGSKASTAIQSEKWDFISIQQNTGLVGQPNSYGSINSLIASIWDKIRLDNQDARFIFHMTWACAQSCKDEERMSPYNYSQETMYNAIFNTVKSEILTNEYFKTVIPSCTAMQNARTSFVGDKFTIEDGFHANLLGRYLIGLMAVKQITNCDISEVTFRPSEVTELEMQMCLEAVNNAFNKPFEVTPSTFIEGPIEEEVHDYANDPLYKELPIKWIDGNYYSRVVCGSNLSNDTAAKNKYFCTPIFEKNQIPVGSAIVIQSGWRVIRHAWETLTTVYTTKENPYSKELVEVDNAFWGVYNYFALNVCLPTYGVISDFNQAHSAVKIYVPVDTPIIDDEDIDPFKNYTRLTINWIDGKYYDRTTASKANPINDAAAVKKFCCTHLITKEEMPNGSIIIIKSGWRILRHAWETNSSTYTTKEKPYTVERIEVDDTFWGEYNFCAFNVCTNSFAVLDNFAEAHDAIMIYVPNSK